MQGVRDQIGFAHQLGHVEGRMNALERKLDSFEVRVEGRLASIESKLDQLTTTLHLGRGGWKALVIVASVLMAVFTLLQKWALPLLAPLGGP